MLNLKKRIAEARQNDEGFTLIELAVVILIIGILLALALPAFLGVRKSAQYKAGQVSTRTAVVSAKALYSDTTTYVGVTNNLKEPGYTYTLTAAATDDSTGPKVVLTQEGVNLFAAVAKSQDRCYMTIDDESTGTATATGVTVWYKTVTGAAVCNPGSAVTAPTVSGSTMTLAGWTNVPVG